VVLSLLFFPCSWGWAQAGFEDSDGKSSLIFQQGGTGRINLTDASLKVSYLYQKDNKPGRFGIELSGKATNGISTLFDKDDIAPEATVKLSFGCQWLLGKKMTRDEGEEGSMIVDDWATIQIGYSRAQYKLYTPTNAFVDQIQKKNFDGFSFTAYYYVLFQGNVSIGVAVGLDHQNNYASLKEIELSDRITVLDSAGVMRTTNDTEKLRQGVFAEGSAKLWNFDIVWIPEFLKYRIGLDLFGRCSWQKGENTFKPGVGVFICEDGAPTKVVGGISFESVEGKLRVGLVGGFNF
jgi:hypothetical protein